MTDELDIYNSAKQLVDRYGDEAAFHARVQAEEFLADGYMEAYELWRRIIIAIAALDGSKPKGTAH